MAAAPETFTIPLGFSLPGIVAGLVRKLTTDGEPASAIERAIRELQGFMHWSCPCSPQVKRSVRLFTRRQARGFVELAREAPYGELMSAVEQACAALTVRCPACRRAGALAVVTPA